MLRERKREQTMKRWASAVLAMLLLCPLAARADGEGVVTAGRTVAVTAAYGGTVAEVSARAGDRVAAEDVLATLAGERVFAGRDGTVARVFAAEGDDADAATELYGAALAVEPVNRFTVYATAESGADSAQTRWISAGETLYMKCAADGSHRGVGVVTQVDDMTYTILCTGGTFSNGEVVRIYRDRAYSSAQKVGEGTVIATEADAYAAGGTVVRCCVSDGDAVEAGQLLMETASGTFSGADWNEGRILAGTDAVVLSLAVQPGDGISQGDVVALICAPEDLQVEFSLSETELADVRAGDGVTVALEDGAECAGTVERILYAPDEAGGYVACVRLEEAPEQLRIGQSVSVRY